MSNVVRSEMERLGITRAELTRITGLGYSTVNDIYSGRSDMSRMTVAAFSRLAEAFGMTMDELYRRSVSDDGVRDAESELRVSWLLCSDKGRDMLLKMADLIRSEMPRRGDDA